MQLRRHPFLFMCLCVYSVCMCVFRLHYLTANLHSPLTTPLFLSFALVCFYARLFASRLKEFVEPSVCVYYCVLCV
uniref:Putative secreted peptide n=1 Tax=Anopheles braziliensis TaxID=58242 RepID=A0A2M3ZWA9_9DIPT